MTSQPWIHRSIRAAWSPPSQGFNGAMTSQPWIQQYRWRSPRCCTSFNGAMTSQPWIRPPGLAYRPLFALQWSHDLSAMDTCCRIWLARLCRASFNGAMTSQPWIRWRRYSTSQTCETLQWSHDLSAMDTLTGIPDEEVIVNVLQWSHDLSAMDTIDRPIICKNNASASMEP